MTAVLAPKDPQMTPEGEADMQEYEMDYSFGNAGNANRHSSNDSDAAHQQRDMSIHSNGQVSV